MRRFRTTVHPIIGTRFLWIIDGAGQSWCIHENDDRIPLGLHDVSDAHSGFARAAVLEHGGGFALFEVDRAAPGRPSRTINAAGPEILRSTYEKRLPHKRTP